MKQDFLRLLTDFLSLQQSNSLLVKVASAKFDNAKLHPYPDSNDDQ